MGSGWGWRRGERGGKEGSHCCEGRKNSGKGETSYMEEMAVLYFATTLGLKQSLSDGEDSKEDDSKGMEPRRGK